MGGGYLVEIDMMLVEDLTLKSDVPFNYFLD